MKLLIIYFLALSFICLRDFLKVKNFDDYVVAGRRQRTPFVFMSLMATVLGASATVGIAARAENIGFAAFWWLGVGAIGLIFQALFLSQKVHDLKVHTLPEIAEKCVGKSGRKLVAFIIVLSWLGIIAAQFAALAGFIGLVLGQEAGVAAVVITAVIVIIYTLLGGQLSVVRTDALQFVILTLAFLAAAIYLFGGFAAIKAPAALTAGAAPAPDLATFGNLALLNEKFTFTDWLLLFFPVGGAYFLGPDVLSRNLIAKEAVAAQKGVLLAGFVIPIFSLIIVQMGMWAATYAPATAAAAAETAANPLFRLVSSVLPLPLATPLAMGLLSALLSSADTCLINSAAILGSDIIGTRRLTVLRLLVVIIGALATFLALSGRDIIGLLLMAYTVYTPGIVAPLAIAIIVHKKYAIKKPLWYAGVCLGGLFGLIPAILAAAAKITCPAWLPHIGFFLSLILALMSLKKRSNKEGLSLES